MILTIKKPFRRTVGFRFDAMAAWLLCQYWGVDLNGMDKIPADEYVSSWVWSAHRSYSMQRYRKPVLTHEQMKRYINRMRKTEWDQLLQAMTSSKAPETDKKKVEPGQSSSSQDGQQE
jgi:hypothetical protein